LTLAERMGAFQAQIIQGGPTEVYIEYLGEVSQFDTQPMTVSLLKGLLTPALKDQVNFVNAPLLAKERGIKIMESKSETAHDFLNLITLKVKTESMESLLAGTLFGKFEPRIVRLNKFRLEAIPEGHMLLIISVDRPGVIGAIASTLGKHNINIERMQVGQEKDQGMNIILLTTDQILLPSVLKDVAGLPPVTSVQAVELL
jgi:D-3-phosphoglycerate dehydrogenase